MSIKTSTKMKKRKVTHHVLIFIAIVIIVTIIGKIVAEII